MRRPDDGFTLPELLVAITLLGIIMVAIGAMITTSFRTSSMVSAELQGSRGPKVVSRYWIPDVEQASVVTQRGGSCGGSGSSVVAFESPVVASAFTAHAATPRSATRTITWCEVMIGRRDQLVRRVDDGSPQVDSTVIVSDLKRTPGVDAASPRYTISVTVPDNSRSNREYTFKVAAMSQVTTTASTP